MLVALLKSSTKVSVEDMRAKTPWSKRTDSLYGDGDFRKGKPRLCISGERVMLNLKGHLEQSLPRKGEGLTLK